MSNEDGMYIDGFWCDKKSINKLFDTINELEREIAKLHREPNSR